MHSYNSKAIIAFICYSFYINFMCEIEMLVSNIVTEMGIDIYKQLKQLCDNINLADIKTDLSLQI